MSGKRYYATTLLEQVLPPWCRERGWRTPTSDNLATICRFLSKIAADLQEG